MIVMAEKSYDEAQLIQELIKKTTFNSNNAKGNNSNSNSTNTNSWSNLPLVSDFVQSSSIKWKKIDEALLVINRDIEEYFLAPESEQKQCWVKLKNLLMNKTGEFADVHSLVLTKTMEELIVRGALELFSYFLEDSDLQADIIKGYANSSKKWLLLALNANQLQMFDYLAENKRLNMDLHKVSVFFTTFSGGAPTRQEIISTSELMAIILAKNPVFINYLINYDKKHVRGLQPEIIKALKKYYPQGLDWLDKIKLYETLENELISPLIEMNGKNATLACSSENLDVFKI